jgi:hypothetical protein
MMINIESKDGLLFYLKVKGICEKSECLFMIQKEN